MLFTASALPRLQYLYFGYFLLRKAAEIAPLESLLPQRTKYLVQFPGSVNSFSLISEIYLSNYVARLTGRPEPTLEER